MQLSNRLQVFTVFYGLLLLTGCGGGDGDTANVGVIDSVISSPIAGVTSPVVAAIGDADDDGVVDSIDNCTFVSNPAQRDTDSDGFGNICDPDFDNNLSVNAGDLAYLKSVFFTTDPHADLDGSGSVNAGDLAILKSFFFKAPGPGVDISLPKANVISPVDGAIDVALDAIISASFNVDILNTSINNATFKLRRDGGDLAATVIFDATDNKTRLSTDNTLALLTSYTATLSTDITDLSGNALVEKSWSFTTRDGSWGRSSALLKADNNDSNATPQIAIDSDGNALAVWVQKDDTTYTHIWSNRYVAGIGWGTAEPIAANGRSAFDPQVAINNNGQAIAVWRQWNGSVFSIWSNRYVAGIGWGAAEQIATNVAALDPQVAIDNNGQAIAVWSQWNGTVFNIWSNRYVAGIGWSTAELIGTNDGDANPPQVAIDNNSQAIAVWSQWNFTDGTESIWSNRYVSGTGWGTAELIETNDGRRATAPQVVIDNNGQAIAVWSQENFNGTLTSIWSNRYVSGTGWGTAEPIETSAATITSTSPQIAINNNDQAIAVWSQENYNGTLTSTWSNRYVAGTGWGIAEPIETGAASTGTSPQIAIDINGHALAIWHTNTDLKSNRYVDGVGWGTAESIETYGAEASTPQIKIDHNGNALAVWSGVDATQGHVYFNRFGNGGDQNGQLITATVFADPSIASCVEAYMNTHGVDFTQEITSLDCSQSDIRFLGGLSSLTNLQTLNLSGNALTNLNSLAKLDNLQVLNLSSVTSLQNIEALLQLEQLTQLDLGNSSNGDINCRDLDTLNSFGVSVTPPSDCRTHIADVVFTDTALQACVAATSALDRLTYTNQLTNLQCPDLAITQLNGIENFANLTAINISGNQISDMTPLVGLLKLESIIASQNPIDNVTALSQVSALQSLHLNDIAALTDVNALLSVTSLSELHLEETGDGKLDCATLDSLAAGLNIFSRPQCRKLISDVVFADTRLETCVQERLTTLSLNPQETYTDDERILWVLCENDGITQLDGLEYFNNLIYAELSGCNIQDLTPLYALNKLSILSLSRNNITDISSLVNMQNLESLSLAQNPNISNIDVLLNMDSLNTVALYGTGVTTPIECEVLDELQALMISRGGTFSTAYDLPVTDYCTPPPPPPPTRITKNDMDYDGRADLIMEYADPYPLTKTAVTFGLAASNQFDISNTYLTHFFSADYSRATGIAVADANNDQQQDLLMQLDWAEDDRRIWRVHLSGGLGLLTSYGEIIRDGGDDARAVAFTDIDNDGLADILIQEKRSDVLNLNSTVYFYMYLNNGSGFAEPVEIYNYPTSLGYPEIVALEDINNDGTADLVLDMQKDNQHCFFARIFKDGAFENTAGISDCMLLGEGSAGAGLADIDGDGRSELFVEWNTPRWAGMVDHQLIFLRLDNNPGHPEVWSEAHVGRTITDGYVNEIDYTQGKGVIAITDLNGDGRADILMQNLSDTTQQWIAYIAQNHSKFERQVWRSGLATDITLGLRDYNDDGLADLLTDAPIETSPGVFKQQLYVSLNNGTGFNTPTLWHEDTSPPRIIGLEEDGLTSMAHNRTELIAWAGIADLYYTQNEFSRELWLNGRELVEGDALRTNNTLGKNQCRINYSEADATVTKYNAGASAEFGMLTCSIAIGDRVSVTNYALYGGCEATSGLYGASANCEVGTVGTEIEVDLSPAPSTTLELKGPNAEACGGVSHKHVCANVGAELASTSASLSHKDSGLQAGGKLAIGVGAGAGFDIEGSVISGQIDLALIVGGSIEFSVDPVQTGKFFYKVGKSSYLFAENAGETIIFAAGPVIADAANLSSDTALLVGGEAVYYAEEAGKTTIVVFEDAGAGIGTIFTSIKNALADVGDAVGGAVIDLGNGISSGASDAWDFLTSW